MVPSWQKKKRQDETQPIKRGMKMQGLKNQMTLNTRKTMDRQLQGSEGKKVQPMNFILSPAVFQVQAYLILLHFSLLHFIGTTSFFFMN